MIVSIMQPAYLAWIGYYQRIAISDLHIVLDHVGIDKNSKTKFANRNRILSVNGPKWLTIPIKTKNTDIRLNKIEIDNETGWMHKHWQTIRHSYKKTDFFKDYEDFFTCFFSAKKDKLIEAIIQSDVFLRKELNIHTPVIYSSDMDIFGTKNDLILNICRSVNATTYISGPFGRSYLDEASFKHFGIDIVYHSFEIMPYQQTMEGFVPYLSVIDLLFNCGCKSKEILMAGQSVSSDSLEGR